MQPSKKYLFFFTLASAIKPISLKNAHPDASNILNSGQFLPNAFNVASVKFLQFEIHKNCK